MPLPSDVRREERNLRKLRNTVLETEYDAVGAKMDTLTVKTSFRTARGSQVGFFRAIPVSQPTTSVGSATFAQNSGNAVNDASTFDGYTVAQIVQALRGLGLLE